MFDPHPAAQEQQIALAQGVPYISNTRKEHQSIKFITSDSQKAVENVLFLEYLKKKGLEVLFMMDPVDKCMVQHMKDYNGKKIVSITKEDRKLEELDDGVKAPSPS